MENTTIYLFERFLDIEEAGELFDYQINGVKIWQYVRFSVCAKILEELTGIRTTAGSVSGSAKKEKKNWLLGLRRSQFLVHKKEFLIISHPRRIKENDTYRCFVTEEFVSRLRRSYYVFECPFGDIHFEPAETKNLKYVDMRFLYENRFINYDIDKYQEQINALAKYILQLMEEGYEYKFSKNFEKYLIACIRQAMQNRHYARIYANIFLRIIRPRLIFMAVSYSVFNQSLISVAKQMKIPVVELQHGRMGKTHAAYNFRRKRELESFPDYIFTYGEYECQKVRFPISKKQIFAVGYPELERKAKGCGGVGFGQDYLTVVFTPGAMEGEVVSQYALEMAERFSGKNIKIIYKLHPTEYQDWKKKYPQLKESNLEVIDNNDHDIYYYLSRADYVIGISSTSLFEAMMFRTQIMVIKAMDYKKTEAVYSNRCAVLVSSVDEAAGIIENRGKVRKQYDCDFYFKKHSIKNMNEAIKIILNQ